MEDPKTITNPDPAPAPAADAPKLNDLPLTDETKTQPTTTQTGDVPAPIEPAQQDVKSGEEQSNGAPAEQPSAANGTPPTSIPIDQSMPEDFDGEVSTTNELPSHEVVKKIENYIVLDRHGKSHTFKSLYNGPNVARRMLVIFVRHFFCGNCQDYLRTLSESITPEMLLRLPVSTFITVIGCGDPGLIDMYANETKCPFPIYTDPTRSLFQAFDMTKTWDAGSRPAYMKKNLARGAFGSFVKAIKQIPTGKVLKSGNFAQVGGEFLFEPLHLDTPISTPLEERSKPLQQQPEEAVEQNREEKKITWCHRMKTTRDHAEIPEMMEILGLDGQGQPIKNTELWKQALSQRKGTGLSMASQMNQRGKEEAETGL